MEQEGPSAPVQGIARTWRLIQAQVELPGPVAAWVLSAHFYATVLPLVLVLAVNAHWDYVQRQADYPVLFYVAAALLCAGSAFEVAQNALDRWYLTPETGSALAPAFCDGLFFAFVTSGQGAIALALGGHEGWVLAIVAGALVAAPILYLAQRATFLPLAVTGLLGTLLAYRAFGDPIVFLGLGLPALTLYFFGLLLRTGAQGLHGCTTAAAASGLWFTVLAIGHGASGRPTPWALVIGTVVVAVAGALALRPRLARLRPTPRLRRQVARDRILRPPQGQPP